MTLSIYPVGLIGLRRAVRRSTQNSIKEMAAVNIPLTTTVCAVQTRLATIIVSIIYSAVYTFNFN